MILLLWLYLMSIEFFSFCYPINAQDVSLVSQKIKNLLPIYEETFKYAYEIILPWKLFNTHPLWLFNNEKY